MTNMQISSLVRSSEYGGCGTCQCQTDVVSTLSRHMSIQRIVLLGGSLFSIDMLVFINDILSINLILRSSKITFFYIAIGK